MAQSFRMWARIVTTLVCLIVFMVELTLDSSTSFVRENPAPQVGKLVIVKTSIEKKQAIPQLPDAPDNAPIPDKSNDLAKFSAPSCAGQVAESIVLSVPQPPISKLTILGTPPYQEPQLSNLQRPPSA